MYIMPHLQISSKMKFDIAGLGFSGSGESESAPISRSIFKPLDVA